MDTLARQACTTCRRQKRKCTRERPSCHLCRKSHRHCQYPPQETDHVADSPDAGQAAASTGQAAAVYSLVHAPRDPDTSVFFLDSYIFSLNRASIKRPTVELPADCLRLLDDEASLQHDLSVYFARFHPTFPIVSKLRLPHELFSGARTPDTLFLLLVIRLVCRTIEPGRNADDVALFYSRAKLCAAHVEAAGVISLRRLQAGLLLALHELSYGIYPAAYMSVGVCARLGQVMGIHSGRDAVRMSRLRLSMVECEESHRAWWATLILDRYVNIGLDDRPFACRDANPDEHLPMEELSWETGESSIRPSLALTSDAFVAAPPFARTCQAAHLLTRVLRHINDKQAALHGDYEAYYTEALQLNRILSSFATALWQELQEAIGASAITGSGPSKTLPVLLFPGFSLAVCALMTFYDIHACIEVDNSRAAGLALQLETQTAALEGAKAIMGTVCAFAQLVRQAARDSLYTPPKQRFSFSSFSSPPSSSASPDYESPAMTPVVSPLVVNSLYQTSKALFLYYQETARADLLETLQEIKDTLADLGRLWPVSNDYLTILDMDCLKTI